MKHMKRTLGLLLALTCLLCAAGCASDSDDSQEDADQTAQVSETDSQEETSGVASSDDYADPVDMEVEGDPIYAADIADGTYDITVESSSSMFNIVSCQLTVENGEMTAVMTMGGTGYLYVYMGTAEQAAQASEEEYISYQELSTGEHTFTVPVEALNMELPCAAFSKNKELWYDRTLVFTADGIPTDALSGDVLTTVEDLGLEDGSYTVEVTLSGGSGKASVQSPCALTVENGQATATLIWSSSNYDYMVVDDVQYDPISTEDGSTFEIPVTGFDYDMAVSADTTAMSQPYLIDYTLNFDSSTVTPAE